MAKIHRFVPQEYHLTLGSHPPALRIEPGDTVVTSTVDASGCDATGAQVVVHGNAQTGPFYVEGAQPGDVLVVQFDHIYPNRIHGYSGCGLSSNVVDPSYVREIPGEGDRLHQALQHATTEMLRWLQRDYGLDAPMAHMVLG